MKNNNKIIVCIEYILVFLLVILSLKKGGFYTSDIILFNFFLVVIGIIGLVYSICRTNDQEYFKFDIISFLLLLLSLAYLIPIFLHSTSNVNEAIFEALRYFNVYIIYNIVKKSDNKKIFSWLIIVVGIIQSIIGIDGLANRYFEPLLKHINSGYLNRDFDRLSGTIQYANVTAIIFFIAMYICIHMYIKCSNTGKGIFAKTFLYSTSVILLTSIILTKSRTVLVICLIAAILYILNNRDKFREILLLLASSFVLSLICSSMILGSMSIDKVHIYILYFSMYIVIPIVYIGTYIILKKIKKLNMFNKDNQLLTTASVLVNKYIWISISGIIVIYILLSLTISKPLYISSKSALNNVTRTYYDIKPGNNTATFMLKELDQNTKYKIELYSVNNSFSTRTIQTINYYDKISEDFLLEFELKGNEDRIGINFICEEGSIEVSDLEINSKSKILEYVLIPSDIVFRMKDLFFGSSSSRDRIEYIKDSFKIITQNPITCIFGTGGEGFKNTYKEIQTLEYTSSEVHNSFLQIFVETGILGFSIIAIIIFVCIKKSKYNNYKIILILFLLHSLVDLNFSYMMMLSIFAILLALQNIGDVNGDNENLRLKLLYLIEGVVYICMLSLAMYIVLTNIF